MNSSTCFGRWRITIRGRSRFAIARFWHGAKIKPEPKLLEIGKAEVVKHGRDVAISDSAHVRSRGEAARNSKKKGVSVALINPRWIKPMGTGTLEFFARSVELCAIEDHVLHNGFGAR